MEPKVIKFRPLRRVKKTGKITVASYMQWRKVKSADYNKFNLIVVNEYAKMLKDEYVYDHEGKQLFFFDYFPNEIQVFDYRFEFLGLQEAEEIRNKAYELNTSPKTAIRWGDNSIGYNSPGVDCDGIPVFSHYTADEVAKRANTDEYLMSFEPLTVETVIHWFGWFLCQLENSSLSFTPSLPPE